MPQDGGLFSGVAKQGIATRTRSAAQSQKRSIASVSAVLVSHFERRYCKSAQRGGVDILNPWRRRCTLATLRAARAHSFGGARARQLIELVRAACAGPSQPTVLGQTCIRGARCFSAAHSMASRAGLATALRRRCSGRLASLLFAAPRLEKIDDLGPGPPRGPPRATVTSMFGVPASKTVVAKIHQGATFLCRACPSFVGFG